MSVRLGGVSVVVCIYMDGLGEEKEREECKVNGKVK